ncbi:hypothetical protein [Mycobacterium sp. Marseille-P9652]|uniref:hypothetical protein n=1 Tax=Mycobacterium sp. Marseille-P9652 TaxID=2654950 RepID=UPI0012E8554F|nr:hypothetical protein [Mycobacterium sp. Marseille-P9652]
MAKLLNSLPPGYPSGTCTPTTPKPNTIWSTAVAMVNCDQNTNQGGPSRGVYGLFANADALNKAFADDTTADNVQLVTCPGADKNPNDWHHPDTPTVKAGEIACATYKGHPNLVWSNQSKLLLCDVFGDPPTIDELHTWWGDYGG